MTTTGSTRMLGAVFDIRIQDFFSGLETQKEKY